MTPAVARQRLKCYIASPLGFTEGGRAYYAATYLPSLARAVETIDPWTVTSPAEVREAIAKGTERDLWLAVGARNAAAIRGADVVVAYLEGQEVDSGTAAEIGYAAGLGIRCYGIRSDLREAGERGVAVNLQVESFIVQSGGRVAVTLEDLIAALTEEARGRGLPGGT